MADVIDVANYILEISREESPDGENDLISNMKLQKLVYLCQGYALALHDRPLFPDQIEAWEHGPVCPPLYHAVKKYGKLPITESIGDQEAVLSESEKRLIGMVYGFYRQYSASGLRDLTHREGPWRDTCRNAVIAPDAMIGYFDSLMEVAPADIPPSTESEKHKLAEILEKAEADGEIDLSRFCVPVGIR